MDADPTDWFESIVRERRLSRTRLALLLAATAAALSGTYQLLVGLGLLWPSPDLRRFVDDPRWDHVLGGPLVIANLLSAVLLLGGRRDRAWLPRSLLLVLVSMAALAIWSVDHGHFFGWRAPHQPSAEDPLRVLVLRLIALIRVVTMAELVALFMADLSGRHTLRLGRAAILMACSAFLLWLLLSLTHLDWAQVPPQWRNIQDPRSFALLAGSILARAVSSMLLALLCGRAYADSKESEMVSDFQD